MIGSHVWRTHIDPGALKALLSEEPNIKTMIDVGCGPGGMRSIAEANNLQWLGLDGDPAVKEKNDRIWTVNMEIPNEVSQVHHHLWRLLTPLTRPVLGWSVEHLEHLHQDEGVANVGCVFKLCDIVCITHSLKVQPSHHTVKPAIFWTEIFHNWGFMLDYDLTRRVRKESRMVREFMRETGLVFRKV